MTLKFLPVNASHDEGLYRAVYAAALDALTRVSGNLLEIGTHCGGSAYVMMQAMHDAPDARQPRMLVTVDPWGLKPYPNSASKYGDMDQRAALINLSAASDEFGALWHHCKCTAQEFFERIQPHPVWYSGAQRHHEWAFVMLDGEHSCESILRELMCVMPHLVSRGTILLDNTDHRSSGSIRACLDVVARELGFDLKHDHHHSVLIDNATRVWGLA